jgi:CheY-like chemotaxis protein
MPKRKMVLVVEDNATIGGILVALLREEGYRALRAWDAKEAVRIARDRRPDLVVFELSLPYPEGVEALRELKAQPETREAPMILVAGNTIQLPSDEREQLTEYISKPVDIDRLINACRRALGDPEHEISEKDYSSSVDSHLYHW